MPGVRFQKMCMCWTLCLCVCVCVCVCVVGWLVGWLVWFVCVCVCVFMLYMRFCVFVCLCVCERVYMGMSESVIFFCFAGFIQEHCCKQLKCDLCVIKTLFCLQLFNTCFSVSFKLRFGLHQVRKS